MPTPRPPTMLSVGKRRGFEATLSPLAGTATCELRAPTITGTGGEEPSEGSHPNQPSGAVLVENRAFQALDENGWADSNGSASNPSSAYLTLSGGVMRHTFPAGHSGNGSSSTCSTNDYAGWAATSRVYLDYRIRYSSNWYAHDFSGVNKMLYIGNAGSAIPIIMDAHGQANGEMYLRIAMQGGEIRNLDWDDGGSGIPNGVSIPQSAARIPRGEWVRITLLMHVNTPGVANGQIHAWVNDVKTHQYMNRSIYASGANLSNQILHVRPIYGGQNASNVPHDQYLEFDRFYLSRVNA